MRCFAVSLFALSLIEAAPPASDAEREAFLRNAEAISFKPAPGGATGTVRVTLSDGKTTHDAHVQSLDIRASLARDILHLESEFTDSYRYNIAAYLLDRLLGMNMIPPTVEREFRGKPASYAWWINGTQTEAQRFLGRKSPPDPVAWSVQMKRVDIFDFLIDNTDRNKSNLLIDREWHVWMIDHSRAFRVTPNRPLPVGIDFCVSDFRSPVEGLDPAAVTAALGPYLGSKQIESILERRRVFLAACPESQPK